MHLQKINIAEKLNSFSEHWSPKIVAELNGQYVKVAKLRGEFQWHYHKHEDELFWIINGKMQMHFRTSENQAAQIVELQSGDVFVVPKGIEHKPVANDEVQIVLFEPASTLNTGNLDNQRTRRDLERI